MSTSESWARPGDWVDGYQVQAQAPVSFIAGSRTRYIEDCPLKGAWSDPWWLYDPARGWAVARRWKSKEQRRLTWPPGCQGSGVWVDFAAMDEVVAEPWRGGLPGEGTAAEDERRTA
jgi:hypothetical protein